MSINDFKIGTTVYSIYNNRIQVGVVNHIAKTKDGTKCVLTTFRQMPYFDHDVDENIFASEKVARDKLNSKEVST